MRASDPRPAVVVDDVSKSFRLPHERMDTLKERALHPFRRSTDERLDAVRDVSFSVAEGEFFGIVGRNGSGKSTLLKCLAGIYGVDRGRIYIDGRLSTFIELGVGFNPDLAARDNVLLNAAMLGVPVREARARFDEIIAFAELEDFVDLKIKNYSSGMLVRLAFATAIQADADILLIDEVLAVGDAAFQQKCFDVFTRLKDEGKTILFITHDMGPVRRFCDRAMLLERGEIVSIDKPTEIADRYLRMNFGQLDGEEDGDSGVRFSTGATTILEAWTEDEDGNRRVAFLVGEHAIFKVRVRFEQEVVEPNLNIVWTNERGDNVFAVSTVGREEGTGRYAPGEEVVVGVWFLVALAPGRHSATFNISERGSGLKLIERWDKLLSILVANPMAGGGLVDLPHHLEISRVAVPAAAVVPEGG